MCDAIPILMVSFYCFVQCNGINFESVCITFLMLGDVLGRSVMYFDAP